MKNITAQYRDLQEGKMTKANFMANVRMQFPDYISPVNNYEDMVKILKSKRILSEDYSTQKDLAGLANDSNNASKNRKWVDILANTAVKRADSVDDISTIINHLASANGITDSDIIQAALDKAQKDYPSRKTNDDDDLPASYRMYNSDAWVQAQRDAIGEGEEMYEKKAFYLVDETGDVIDSVMAVDSQEASDYFEKEYEGIGSSLTVIHTSNPDELRGGVAEDINKTDIDAAQAGALHEDAVEDPYKKGFQGNVDGYHLKDCPYEKGTTEAELWKDGWLDCETEKQMQHDEETYNRETGGYGDLYKETLNEAEDKTEGSYKKVTGKDLYSFFNEIDRLNPYEVRKGINIEMGMEYKPTPNYFTDDFNPESLAKATRKVLKNLQKDPAYYTNMISLPTEKRTNMLQKPAEVKTKADGYTTIKGFTDAKSNTETNLAKKERAKGSPEGVKEMKPSKKSMGGLKTMKFSDKLPKGVELMKEADLTTSPGGLNAIGSDLAARAKEIYKQQEEERKKQNQKPKAGGEDMKAKLKELVMQEIKKRMTKEMVLTNPKTKQSVATSTVAGTTLAQRKGFTQKEPGGEDITPLGKTRQ